MLSVEFNLNPRQVNLIIKAAREDSERTVYANDKDFLALIKKISDNRITIRMNSLELRVRLPESLIFSTQASESLYSLLRNTLNTEMDLASLLKHFSLSKNLLVMLPSKRISLHHWEQIREILEGLAMPIEPFQSQPLFLDTLKSTISFITELEKMKEALLINDGYLNLTCAVYLEALKKDGFLSPALTMLEKKLLDVEIQAINIEGFITESQLSSLTYAVLNKLTSKRKINMVYLGSVQQETLKKIQSFFQEKNFDTEKLFTIAWSENGKIWATTYYRSTLLEDNELKSIQLLITAYPEVKITFELPVEFRFSELQTLNLFKILARAPKAEVRGVTKYFQKESDALVKYFLQNPSPNFMMTLNELTKQQCDSFLRAFIHALGEPLIELNDISLTDCSPNSLQKAFKFYPSIAHLKNKLSKSLFLIDADFIKEFIVQEQPFLAIWQKLLLSWLEKETVKEIHIKREAHAKGLSSAYFSDFVLKLLEMKKLTLCSLSIKNLPGFDIGLLSRDKAIFEEMSLLGNLNLINIGLDSKAIIKLSRYLRNNRSLQNLDLSKNPIGKDGLVSLGEALAVNSRLISLKLEQINIESEEQVCHFINSFKEKNAALTQLLISSSKINGNFISRGETIRQIFHQPIMKAISSFLSKNISKSAHIFTALAEDNAAEMKRLFEEVGSSIYYINEHGETAFHLAVRDKREKCLAYLLTLKDANHHLLDNPPDPNNAITFNQLWENADEGLKKKINARIQVETKVNNISILSALGIKNTPLKRARSEPFNEDMAPIEKQPRLEAFQNISGLTATIYYAVIRGNIELIRGIPNLAQTRFADKSLLHLAIQHQQISIAEYLLQKFPELASEKDSMSSLALHYACQACASAPNMLPILNPLIAHSDNVNQKDSFNLTPIYWLILSYAGKDFGKQPKTNNSMYLEAIWGLLGKGALIEELLFDPARQYLMSAVHASVYAGYEIFKLLWHKVSNHNLQDAQGNTPLHIAAMLGDVGILERILIEPDINIHCLNANSKSAYDLLLSQEHDINTIRKMTEAIRRYKSLPRSTSLFWMKNLAVQWGSESGKSLEIEADRLHAQLKLQHDQETMPGNKGKFSISLIVSPPKNQVGNSIFPIRRVIVWQDNSGSIMHVSQNNQTKANRIIARFNAAPDKAKNASFHGKQPLTIEEIIKKANAQSFEFARYCHHSEQAILDKLEQKSYLEQMVNDLFVKGELAPGMKVYAVIIDLHSTNITCENCAISLLGSMNPKADLFAGRLQATLQEKGLYLPKHRALPCIARVSSTTKKTIEEEIDYQMDLRAIEEPLILHKIFETEATATGASRRPI